MATQQQQDRAVTQALSGIGAAIGKKIVLLNPGDEYERFKQLLSLNGYQVDRQPATSPAARPALFVISAPQQPLNYQQLQGGVCAQPQETLVCSPQQQQLGYQPQLQQLVCTPQQQVYYQQGYGVARSTSDQQLLSQYQEPQLNTLVFAQRT